MRANSYAFIRAEYVKYPSNRHWAGPQQPAIGCANCCAIPHRASLIVARCDTKTTAHRHLVPASAIQGRGHVANRVDGWV